MSAPQDREMRVDDNEALPVVLAPDPAGVPAELTALPQWVCWRWEWKGGKVTKVPVDPRTEKNASVDDPSTWSTIDEALATATRLGLPGIGFMFDADDRYFGIDSDDAYDPETGGLTAAGAALLERFATYAEPSVRRRGLHLIGTTDRVPHGGTGNKRGPTECYWRGRFFAFTGCPLPGYDAIAERTEELLAWHPETFPPKPEPAPIAAVPLEIDDRALLERCLGNAKFRTLHQHGDAGDYGGDASSADLAYVNVIVRNGGTPDQADRLYRESAIVRPKWDQRRGQTTYGERTIARAFDGTVIPFAPTRPTAIISPERERLAATGTDDATADALPDDVAALKAMIVDLTRRVEAAERRADAAEARTEMLGRVQSTTGRIIRNRRLGQERMTAVALSYAFANREAAGDAGDGGLYAIPVARIAETAGVSEDSAAKHVKKLADAGVLRKELRWVPERVDTATGEILPGRHRQYIGPAEGRVVDFVEAVAALAPSVPKGWGGARTACPDHPNAGTVKRWTLHCAECDRTLDKGEDFRAAEPKPQDAEPPPDTTFAGDTPIPEPRIAAPYPPVDGHLRDRKRRVDHNAQPPARIPIIPDAGTTVAAAFQRGQGLPGMPSESPPDRWTG